MGRPSAADQEEQPLRSPDRRRPGFRQMLADSNKRPLSCLLGRDVVAKRRAHLIQSGRRRIRPSGSTQTMVVAPVARICVPRITS
jgi:hypothetical protein